MDWESVALKKSPLMAVWGFEGICIVEERAWLWSVEILWDDLLTVVAAVQKRDNTRYVVIP